LVPGAQDFEGAAKRRPDQVGVTGLHASVPCGQGDSIRGGFDSIRDDSIHSSARQLLETFDRDTFPEAAQLGIREDWDESCDAHNSGDSGPRQEANPFTCSRGPSGTVMALGLSAYGRERRDANTSQTVEVSMLETLQRCSPGAMHGQRVSWVKGDVLGHGSLGSVFKALDQRTGAQFAVKEVRIDQKDEHDVKFKAALENEVTICQELKHAHIVSYLGHDYFDSKLYIYLEYMAGGSIAQVLSQFGPFDEALTSVYTRGLLEGLEYLHTDRGAGPVLHRDIKGANVLVGLDCKVKLSDFGCSKRTSSTVNDPSKTMRGSIPWMAPEVIQQKGYGRGADIWSFGCVIIEMGTAKHPWGHFDNIIAAMRKIGMSEDLPPLPENASDDCKEFLLRCLRRDRATRPTAKDLLQMPFVRDVIIA
jgi:hypothetical protein